MLILKGSSGIPFFLWLMSTLFEKTIYQMIFADNPAYTSSYQFESQLITRI